MTKSAVQTDLITFTEEIINGKLHFLCSATWLNVTFVCKVSLGRNTYFSKFPRFILQTFNFTLNTNNYTFVLLIKRIPDLESKFTNLVLKVTNIKLKLILRKNYLELIKLINSPH